MQESALVFPTVLFCYSSGPSLEFLLTHPPILTLTFLLSHSYSPTLTLTLLKINTTHWKSFFFHCFFPPLVSNPSYSWSCSYTCIAHSLLPMALRLFSYEYTRVLLYSYSRSLVIFSRSYASKSILEFSFSSLERIKQLS